MADIRTSATSSGLVPRVPATVTRSESVKAAQRAFFQAALNGVGPVAGVQPRTVQPVVSPTASVQPARQGGDPPSRLLRPGSLLDIKV